MNRETGVSPIELSCSFYTMCKIATKETCNPDCIEYDWNGIVGDPPKCKLIVTKKLSKNQQKKRRKKLRKKYKGVNHAR